jgi:outer membrane protein assembly factor BamB
MSGLRNGSDEPENKFLRRTVKPVVLIFGCSLFAVVALIATARIPAARAQLAAAPWPMFRHDLQHTGLSQFDTHANVGAQKWKLGTGAVVSSPAVGADGTIYVSSPSTRGGLFAINPDGTLKWLSSGAGFSSPAIGANGTIYISGWGNNFYLYAINSNGTVKSSFLAGSVYSSPAVGPDGTIYAGGNRVSKFDPTLDFIGINALDPDGTLKWQFDTNSVPLSSPAVATDGTIYVGDNTALYAIFPNGKLKWTFGIAVGYSSPAIGVDGTIYVGSNDGSLYAITSDGTQKWKFTTGVSGSPAIGADRTIYVGSGNGNLYAINSDGTQKWKFTTGQAVRSSAALGSDGTIYVGSDDKNLYAINPDGSLKWKFITGGIVDSSPTIGVDGTIYVGSSDGFLYAVRSHVGLSPGSLSFPGQMVGTISTAKDVTLSNQQAAILNISKISASGDFHIVSTTCGSSLGPRASCTISVTFKPTSSGTRAGTLRWTRSLRQRSGDSKVENPALVRLSLCL